MPWTDADIAAVRSSPSVRGAVPVKIWPDKPEVTLQINLEELLLSDRFQNPLVKAALESGDSLPAITGEEGSFERRRKVLEFYDDLIAAVWLEPPYARLEEYELGKTRPQGKITIFDLDWDVRLRIIRLVLGETRLLENFREEYASSETAPDSGDVRTEPSGSDNPALPDTPEAVVHGSDLDTGQATGVEGLSEASAA